MDKHQEQRHVQRLVRDLKAYRRLQWKSPTDRGKHLANTMVKILQTRLDSHFQDLSMCSVCYQSPAGYFFDKEGEVRCVCSECFQAEGF